MSNDIPSRPRAAGTPPDAPPDVARPGSGAGSSAPGSPGLGVPGAEVVLVERSFPEAVEFEAVQALEDRFGWCLEQHQITFLGSYFSKDRRRMICLYQAPDAETVREVNRTANMPFDRVWTATFRRG